MQDICTSITPNSDALSLSLLYIFCEIFYPQYATMFVWQKFCGRKNARISCLALHIYYLSSALKSVALAACLFTRKAEKQWQE